MKTLLVTLLTLLAWGSDQAAAGTPVLVATDIWMDYAPAQTAADNATFYIHCVVANTTDQRVEDYTVHFVPTKATTTPPQQPGHITPLLPHTKAYATVEVSAPLDTQIEGYLADADQTPITDPFTLQRNDEPQLAPNTDKTLCLLRSQDAQTGALTYAFGAWMENKSSHALPAYNVWLHTQTSEGTQTMTLPVDTTAVGSRHYVATTFTLPAQAEGYLTLWLTDQRGLTLMEPATLELPEADEPLTFPIIASKLLRTAQVLDEHYHPSEYMGDSLRAGVLFTSHPLSTGNHAYSNLWPQQVNAGCQLYDLYGDTIFNHDRSELFDDFFQYAQHVDESASIPTDLQTMLRGGDYVFHDWLDALGPSTPDTVRIYDPAVVRFDYRNPTIGENIDIRVSANTGYPYADSLVAATPIMHYDLTYVQPHEGQAAGDTLRGWQEGCQRLNFNLPRRPRLAGVDTVRVVVDDPDIGDYLLLTESDFMHHQRVTHIRVADTVRMEVQLQQSTFRLGLDSTATIHYSVDYRWPYVVPEEGDSIPTVRLRAESYKDSLDIDRQDSLVIDSLRRLCLHADSLAADSILAAHTLRTYYVRDSLIISLQPNTFLHEEGDFTFSVDSLPVGTDTPVDFTLRFNATEQKRQRYTMRMENPTIPVEDLQGDAQQAAGGGQQAATYDISGRRINNTHNTPTSTPRIVVQDRRKVLLH